MHPALPFAAMAALQTGFPAACLATAKLVWLIEPKDCKDSGCQNMRLQA